MARQHDYQASVQGAYDAVVALTDAFCQQYLHDEYGVLCRRLADVLARRQPSMITKGKPQAWASGIVRVIGWVNFVDDPSQTPHLKFADVDRRFGVSSATGQAKAATIRKLLKIHRHSEWKLHGRLGDDLAYRQGLIPSVPDEAVASAMNERQSEQGSAADISRSSAADAAVLVGEMHLGHGDYAKAIAAFTQAIENSPTADAYQGRAKAYRSLAELDDQKARECAAQEASPSVP
jgi:hypothetical protein